jgi:hypothetical protein
MHRPWSPRGGAAGLGLPTDEVSQGRRREHRGGDDNTPGKVAAVEAHPSDGSTVRGKKGGGSSTFQGGAGARWPGRATTRSCN